MRKRKLNKIYPMRKRIHFWNDYYLRIYLKYAIKQN